MRKPRFRLKAVANEIMAALKDANLIAPTTSNADH